MDTEIAVDDRTFEDGNVVLFNRTNSKVWQARIRRYRGNWIDISTKEADFHKAKLVACDKYRRMAWLQENDEIDVTRKFKDVATLTISRLQAELDAGTGKIVYKHYIQAINNYLIPAFGNTLVHKVNFHKLLKLEEFRRDKLGKQANRSTINTHNAALNKVFKTAIEQKFMLPIQVPELRNNGEKPKSRPYFSKSEYRKLSRNLREWTKTGHQKKTQEIRELLRDYVLILANTGIRTGEEALSLRWKYISSIKVNEWLTKDNSGEEGLELSVSGKTGRRTLIARDAEGNVSRPLKRIQERFADLANLSDGELYKRNEFAFRLPDGSLIKHERLAKNFKLFLQKYDLLENTAGEERSLYSLRHTYATFAIIDGLDMETLAVQMGTSIAMLERHYSKLKPHMKAGKLGGHEKKARKGNAEKADATAAQIETLRKQIESQQEVINKLLEKGNS